MEVSNKNTYYNSICSAIIVNDDDSMDPNGLGRVQIYIPSIQTDEQYFTVYPEYTTSDDKEHHEGWNMFPWAISLVEGLENGNIVYISNIDNQNNSYIILGLDVNNPANNKGSGGDLSAGSLYGILDLAMPIILHNEVGTAIKDWPDNIPDKNYKTITPYDNGGWSIGLIQWHHARAFDCLYQIAKADSNWESKFTEKGDLYNDLKKSLANNSSSAYRTKYQANYHPSKGSAIYTSIQNMLGSDIGKETQRAFASEDTAESLEKLMGEPYSIMNPAVLIWLADIMNQYGPNLTKTIKKAADICAGGGDTMSQLDTFRNWCKSNLGSYNTYITRRNTTYSYIEELYKAGKLELGMMVSLTSMIASNYIPEAGEYIWPVPSSDQINCFWGDKSAQAVYINGSKKGQYHWGGLWHTSPHGGIDIAPAKGGVAGDQCIAIGDGEVVAVRKGSPHSACGYFVCIKLDKEAAKGYPYVVYMHFCKQSELNVGDRVTAGSTVVGYMGTTGNSTGVHLHIQLNNNGSTYGYNSSTDILPYLGKKCYSSASKGKGSSLLSNIYASVTGNKNKKGKEIIELAKKYVGYKYVWGAEGPNEFDCSGFVQYIYKQFGYKLPRTTGEQIKKGTQIITKKSDYEKLQEADLLHFSGHIGMYIGDNKFIHASNSKPYPKGGVKIDTFSTYSGKSFIKATRII